jgi:prepilin-type processing-associated H-X9-DG protein
MKESRRSWLWILLVPVTALAAFVLWPVWPGGDRVGATRAACLSNLKQLALANVMYTDDFDGKLPSRDHWMDLLHPYEKRYEDMEHCPLVKGSGLYGYSLNARIVKIDDLPRPESVPLVYDSVNRAKNASDLVNSLPLPGRHHGKNNIAYADGHAKGVTAP